MIYTDGHISRRLKTKFLTENDIDEWSEFFDDSFSSRFMPNPDNLASRERAEQLIRGQQARLDANKLSLQAIRIKETNELAGLCGLLVQEINGTTEIEIGYHFIRRHWGNGYATEAARLFRDYCFSQRLSDSIISIILPENIQSKKVALRNGMTLAETNVEFRNNHYDIYRITQNEWKQNHNTL